MRCRRSEESRQFVDELNATCEAVAASGGAFQVVLVSSDRNVDAFAKLLGARRDAQRAPAAHATP
jgi:hypothetical protein